MNISEIAKRIEHTALKRETTSADIKRLCTEALTHSLFGICIEPKFLKEAKKNIDLAPITLVTVIGFPTGTEVIFEKISQTKNAVDLGAQEIDMVLNVPKLKAGETGYVLDDIAAVVEAAGPVPIKVILETAALTEEEKVIACLLSEQAGARFVKTSTGFWMKPALSGSSSTGATIEDVSLMRKTVSKSISVKASGGIASYKAACELIAAGADRLGTSQSVKIIQQL